MNRFPAITRTGRIMRLFDDRGALVAAWLDTLDTAVAGHLQHGAMACNDPLTDLLAQHCCEASCSVPPPVGPAACSSATGQRGWRPGMGAAAAVALFTVGLVLGAAGVWHLLMHLAATAAAGA